MAKSILRITLVLFLSIAGLLAQSKYEFRAAWVSTVLRLDWPSSAIVTSQKAQMIKILNGMEKAKMNAVIFQVRPSCDVFYDSEIEPWSNWLTGTEGKAPNPYYDPLEFAIEEAHKRNIELHAWFNPYRAKKGTSNGVTSEHVFNKHPEWILEVDSDGSTGLSNYYGLDGWALKKSNTTIDYILNPGMAEVRKYVLDVIMEVVNKYDIDGVHMDDYFYPYGGITNEDQSTFELEGRGISNINDWRRNNINIFLKSINDSINSVKSHVKFGMSPFGIWKNNVPSGIVGMDAYSTIFCDPVTWLNAQYIDYITPQLYWEFGGGQDYGKLLPWWAEQAKKNNRHLYSGNAPYRISDNHNWDADELPRQIRLNRKTEGCHGNIYFRINAGILNNPKGFLDSLKTNYYKYPAITPAMTWKDSVSPLVPNNLQYSYDEYEYKLSWQKSMIAADGDSAVRYILYKDDNIPIDITESQNIVEIIDGVDTSISIIDSTLGYYALTALDRMNNESDPVYAGETSIDNYENSYAQNFQLFQNYPNPFNPNTIIPFVLHKSVHVKLSVYDISGKLVENLLDRKMDSGFHKINFQISNYSSGIYFYKMYVKGMVLSKKMVFIK